MKSDFVGRMTDLISSAKQISSELSEDFIALSAISLKSIKSFDIMYSKRCFHLKPLDKSEP